MLCASTCICVCVGVGGTLNSDLLLGLTDDHCHTSRHIRPNIWLLLRGYWTTLTSTQNIGYCSSWLWMDHFPGGWFLGSKTHTHSVYHFLSSEAVCAGVGRRTRVSGHSGTVVTEGVARGRQEADVLCLLVAGCKAHATCPRSHLDLNSGKWMSYWRFKTIIANIPLGLW